MKIKTWDLVFIAAQLVSLAGLALAFTRLPETIPVHWGFDGQADGWGSRWLIFAIGGLPLFCYLMMKLTPIIDPRKDSFAKHEKPFAIISSAIAVALTPIPWIIVVAAFGARLDVGVLARILVGGLFAVMGNFMGKLKPNYFIGIRTPWALADEEVWRKTHRRGAYVFVITGLAMLASTIIPKSIAAAAAALTLVFLGVAYLFVYSYLVYRKKRS